MSMNVKITESLNFGGDMSANRRASWIPTRGCRNISLGIGWTGTGSPVGVLSIETSNHGVAGVAGAAYPVTISTQPAGSAGALMLDNISTDADFITAYYAHTSGGAGAVFTDDSGVAGTSPTLILKE